MRDDLAQRARGLAPRLVAWRRELHRHPELGFEELRTARFVEARLREIGVDRIETGIGRTGVVGILRATRGRGPAVLLRADMDALPIEETPGREYGSTVPGRMHACGHDGHTSMLLGAATLLAGLRDRLPRDVLLCFQPAEEGGGGAREMIADGLLNLVPTGAAFALHVWSQFPTGSVHVRSGPIMAAQDEFTARVRGRGGHGAAPHQALDPIVAAAHVVTALQTVVARSVDPLQPAVVTVGSIQAGSAPNVIPDEARLEGTLRSFDEEVRELLRRRVTEVVQGVAGGVGCEGRVELRPGYPAVINAPAAVEAVRSVAREAFGEDRLHEPAPLAAAEDFAYILERRPGAFVLLGCGNSEKGTTAPHHSPRFDLDEDVLPDGAELLARLALHAELPAG